MEKNGSEIAEDASDLLREEQERKKLLSEKQCYYYCTTFAFKEQKLCCAICKAFCNVKIMSVKAEVGTEWTHNNIECVVDNLELKQQMEKHDRSDYHKQASSWIHDQKDYVNNVKLNFFLYNQTVMIPLQDVAQYQTPNFEESERLKCWSEKQTIYYFVKYEWLAVEGNRLGCKMCAKYRGLDRSLIEFSRVDKKWVDHEITDEGGEKKRRMFTLTNKLFSHENSPFHCSAVAWIYEQKIKDIEVMLNPFPRIEKVEVSKVLVQAVEPHSVETSKDHDWPKCWKVEQKNYFCVKYEWLISKGKNIGCAWCEKFWSVNRQHYAWANWDLTYQEWVNYEIPDHGEESKVQQLSLWSNKLLSHKQSPGHTTAVAWIYQQKATRDVNSRIIQKVIARANIPSFASKQHSVENNRVADGEQKVEELKKTTTLPKMESGRGIARGKKELLGKEAVLQEKFPQVDPQMKMISLLQNICGKLDLLIDGIGQSVKKTEENTEEIRYLRDSVNKRSLSVDDSTATINYKKLKPEVSE